MLDPDDFVIVRLPQIRVGWHGKHGSRYHLASGESTTLKLISYEYCHQGGRAVPVRVLQRVLRYTVQHDSVSRIKFLKIEKPDEEMQTPLYLAWYVRMASVFSNTRKHRENVFSQANLYFSHAF